MRALAIACFLAGCGTPEVWLDATIEGVDDAQVAEADASIGRDAAAPGDAATPEDARISSDAGVPIDAFVPPPIDAGGPLDAGSPDGGPSPLPQCAGPGVWRNTDPWCDRLPQVIADYGCTPMVEEYSGAEWVGDPVDAAGARFVLSAMTSGGTHIAYACIGEPPSGYRSGCELPFERECELAIEDPDYRDGADYVPICAAAETRGYALRILFRDSRVFDCD